MQISKHITFEEATQSSTAIRLKIDNAPNALIQINMRLVAEKCFEPLREWYNKPIRVNSFYRCIELNKAVGGSATSQHCKGEAIDLSGGSKAENKKIFEWCKVNLDFDQIINEYDYQWIHISYKSSGNRKQILVIK